nr:hypothetical protein [Tanacetum cinerariifolium]
MSQGPNECYYTNLLNSKPQQYSSSPNPSNPSTPSLQNSNSSSQLYHVFGTQMTTEQVYQQQLAATRRQTSTREKSKIGGHVERWGSESESLTGVISQDYRRKCEAAEAAYEAKRKKELRFLECRVLEFLMIDPEPENAAYIRRKQQ